MSADQVNSGARSIGRGLAALLIGILSFATPPAAYSANTKTAAPLKVYISVDMEGIAGVVTADQLIPGGFEYERFRRFMTDEAVAAVRGAQAAGATEVVVSDSHGNGESLLIELFPKDVRIVRSWPQAWRNDGGTRLHFCSRSVCRLPRVHDESQRRACSHHFERALYTRCAERHSRSPRQN